MYIKLTNGQPEIYSIGQLRRDNPNISFPKHPSDALLATYDVYPLTRPEPPADYDALTSTIVDGNIEQDTNGNWMQGYVVQQRDLDDASSRIRSRRDRLLAECDWTQLHDTPAEFGGWAAYRQLLRDITQQAGFPYSVTWPTKPE